MRCLFYAPGPACGVYLPAPSFEVARFILYPGLSQHRCEMLCAKGTPTLQMVFFVANYCPLLVKKSTGEKKTQHKQQQKPHQFVSMSADNDGAEIPRFLPKSLTEYYREFAERGLFHGSACYCSWNWEPKPASPY